MLQKQPLFAVIEGIDGSGKTTLVKKLQNRLSGFVNTQLFAEPTDLTDAGREIRRLLGQFGEDIPEDDLSPRLQELFRIDREWDVRNRISPAVERGEIVLLDRYYFSTAAYQGRNFDEVEQILQEYLNNDRILEPHLAFYLDINPEAALRRIQSRNATRDIFEAEEKLEKVYRNYEYIWNSTTFPFPIYRLDAAEAEEEILESAFEALNRHLSGNVSV